MASKAEHDIQKRMYEKYNNDSFKKEITKIADRDLKDMRNRR